MLNDNISIDRQMVEDMLKDLSESESLLVRESQSLELRIKAIRERMEALKAKLSAPIKGANGKGPRLRKGEGVDKILKVLNDLNGLGHSQAQIAEKTGISGSSVYRVLTKYPDKFQIGPDNLWRRKV